MGNRAYLNLYFLPECIGEKEMEYYNLFIHHRKDYSSEAINKILKNKMMELKEVWTEGIFDYGDIMSIPQCHTLEKNGKTYIEPDSLFSKKSMSFEKSGFVPKPWFIMFNQDEYTDKIEINGNEYNCMRYVTTVKEALNRLDTYFTNRKNSRNIELFNEVSKFRYWILQVSHEDALIELDFGEVIQNDECTNYKSLDEYFQILNEMKL